MNKRKTIFMTRALDKAVKKAAHRKEMSQNKFINAAICVAIEALGVEELNDLVAEHGANLEAETEEHGDAV